MIKRDSIHLMKFLELNTKQVHNMEPTEEPEIVVGNFPTKIPVLQNKCEIDQTNAVALQ